jgi:hypothetical protein
VEAVKFETKLKNKKTGYVQYEIKFTTDNGTQGVVVVGLDGWDQDQGENRNNYADYRFYRCTKGKQVRMSMNGPSWFSLDELSDLNMEINRCYRDLYTNYFGSKDVEQ